MKKIFLAIICLTLCVGQMMANANSEKEMERLTKEFLAHYEGNLPTGTEISADSSSININFLEFIFIIIYLHFYRLINSGFLLVYIAYFVNPASFAAFTAMSKSAAISSDL